ncbi:aspartate-semialdehyde dehydrogenase [Acetivibrio saccincola]|jgi:aspartate-semialdehyde dehydrogenase|uniref:Aspartate-semialdehyde dehydrogenase n=1 Tax=Acetivibrio saccincola TaxID=1677857 RepID=A0A2K9E861_9FIRM|nr:aspartate-semialdehyde dehydrogenase [Acetivibrio saccincola]AUG57736.1 Aspartate-semialdehyde dehydrogenase [Acetivibrio saccincola]NLW27860.1 aspartate-semialdehyde dehydrogenase [Acetivibrio saccincola]PQQ67627.1 aspartate-semialdehyde dehydrogenase [Acetivibrio saccincola]HOA97708.1 aspartate-semialdehyde dehydrogenase [Acetivibrio saccincola]HQD28714.1 aspartate-semialdehyde dehydrogenase [Acetivibrio saccincola]
MKQVSLAVVGATGMVGRTILKVLEERKLPIEKIYFFSSKRSAGTKITFNGEEYIVEELTEESFDRGIDIALFSAGGSISEKYAPIAASKGCVVVDNSSFWRMDPEVPLVVPEVNPGEISRHKGIIANPNCSTIQAVVALKPLEDKYRIKRIVYSTYQAVSGAGMAGYKDLEEGLKGKAPEKFPHPIAGNCLPHIDVFLPDGYTKEEKKMIDETKKILGRDDLKVTATTVRVPVFNSHSESINVEFEKPFDLEELKEVLKNAPGVIVEDDVSNNIYPLPINASGKDEVFVGRIRRDDSVESGINFWVVADNIRKGAATNTVQIAEELIKMWNEQSGE